jgi:hypothetical protein
MEYRTIIWDPHTANNIGKLKMVTRGSARFVMGNNETTSSVSVMINELHWYNTIEANGTFKSDHDSHGR